MALTREASPRNLGAYGAYLFDVDGTLLYPDEVVPGAAETLMALKDRGKAILAVTNNSSLRRHDLAERFRRFGLPLDDAEVFSAMVATAQLVAHEKPGATVHVFGNPGLRMEVEAAGLEVVDGSDCEYLVVGNHASVTYEAITTAFRALLGGARFVAVNADRVYLGRDGGLVPGAGAFVAALERSAGRGPDVIVGKPSATILLEAARSVGRPPSSCLYVGDNPDVDVAGAHAAGMDALLVRTGVGSHADDGAEVQRPEHVLDSVASLQSYLARRVPSSKLQVPSRPGPPVS